MRRRVRYEPSAEVVAGEFYGTIQADLPAGEASGQCLCSECVEARIWEREGGDDLRGLAAYDQEGDRAACRHREPVGCARCERAAIVFCELADANKCPNPCRPAFGAVCVCGVEADRIADGKGRK